MISIIIPVYNKLDNLRAVLKCLLMQTETNFEVIISDDGSDEKIIQGIKDIVEKATFKIKYVWQDDLGFRAGQARNNGARKASGDYLLFLDQDVIFSKSFLHNIYSKLNKKNIIIYRTVYTNYEEKEKVIKEIESGNENFSRILSLIDNEKLKRLSKEIKKDSSRAWRYRFKLKKYGPPTLGLFLIPKNIFEIINGFDEEFMGYGFEDVEFSERLYRNFYKSKILNEKTVHLYHQSLTETNKKDLDKNHALKNEKKYLKNKRAFYGLDNRKDKDEIIFKELN